MTELGRIATKWAERSNPWTNVYGLGRTIIALATFLTLALNDSTTLFRPAAGFPTYPNGFGLGKLSLFCLLGKDHLELARWLAVGVLMLVGSGWRPRITGLLHWWIAFSLQASAMVLDGGDQAAAVLALLLIPVTLTDRRRWHWQHGGAPRNPRREILMRLVALSALLVIRVQVAGIYFHAAVGKMKVREWVDGTVLYYWFTDPTFGSPDWLRPFLMPLLQNGISVSLLTWGSMALEVFLFAALVMPKFAWKPFLWLGILFHASIAVIQGLPSFSLTMAGALILYLRPLEDEFRFPVRRPAPKETAASEAGTGLAIPTTS